MYKTIAFYFGWFGLLVGLSVVLLTIRTESQVSDDQITQMIKKGVKHAKRREFKEAEEVFKKVLAQQPENAVAHNNLANSYVLEGRYASAIREYYTALRYDSTDTSIYLNLGTVYHLQMEITKNEADIGTQKSPAPKQDWQDGSEWAFNEAFKKISSVIDACHILQIPSVEDPQYSWVQRLLYEAAKRNNKLTNLKAGGVRHGSQWRVPVYWK
jgi:tetratricopeptide (TPR) repeat protein